MRINPQHIRAVAADLFATLGDDFDADTFWDTLDGETDALDVIDRALSVRADAKMLAAAAKEQADALRARSTRLEGRARAMDDLLFAVLDAAGQKKVERPAATVSRRKGSVSVSIDDADAIPTQLCKVVKTPDKSAIRKQIEAGEAVPGASLVMGADGVTVRVA